MCNGECTENHRKMCQGTIQANGVGEIRERWEMSMESDMVQNEGKEDEHNSPFAKEHRLELKALALIAACLGLEMRSSPDKSSPRSWLPCQVF